jgi:hypothetical protein
MLAAMEAERLAKEEAAIEANQETIFVFEMIRHGARSHYEDNVDSYDFFGVGKGHLTKLGRQETSHIGMERRMEYLEEKQLLP